MAELRSSLFAVARRIMASRTPDFYVGGRDNPYMLRWWVIPRNPLFNIYLHRFLRDDDDRALHDHPWISCSIVLDGGYFEHLAGDRVEWRDAGAIICRRSVSAHRISLPGPPGERTPATTLFVTGPRLRRWGFHCPQGWVHWKAFVAETDSGNVGRGCGETA